GVGLAFGFAMLTLGRVECHGSDIISYVTGKGAGNNETTFEAMAMQERAKMLRGGAPTREYAPPPKPAVNPGPALEKIRGHLADGDAADAWAGYQKVLTESPSYVLPEPTLINLLTSLQQKQLWPELLDAGRNYLQHYQAQQSGVRLTLASVLIVKEQRPRQALTLLRKLPSQLTPAQANRRDDLTTAAQQQIDAGELEGPSEDW
ncbi:MAG: hypothetical protein ACREDP_25185, partial [Bradyrhizobium sp.]